MGKKKSGNKTNANFQVLYRSTEDIGNTDKTLAERIFSVIEKDKKRAIQEGDQAKQKILAQFSTEDVPAAPKKKPAKNYNESGDINHTKAIASHVSGRGDLWINHLMKMKAQAKAELDEEEAKEAAEASKSKQKILQQLTKKALQTKSLKTQKELTGKDDKEGEDEEGWEDDEEGEEGEEEFDVEEEWEEEEGEEYEEEEYEEFEEEEEDEEEEEEIRTIEKAPEVKTKQEKGKKKPLLEYIEIVAAPKIQGADFPTLGGEAGGELEIVIPQPSEEKLKEKALEEKAEEEIDLRKVTVEGDVKMKRYDDMGVPIDGYNYYQHIVDSHQGGEPMFSYTMTYDHVVQLDDNDFKIEKMNAEEKELYEALQAEEKGGYEEIEDDFFDMLTKDNNVKVLDEPQKKAEAGKKTISFKKEEEIMEIETTKGNKPEKEGDKKISAKKQDSILKRQDFQKVINEHVSFLKEKFKADREKNKVKYQIESEEEEDEDVEEVDSFGDEDEEKVEHESIRRVYDAIPYEQDYAARRLVEDSSSESEESEEEHVSYVKSDKQVTMADSELGGSVNQTTLNIIKEKREPRKRKAEEDEKKKEGEGEEESDEEDDGPKVEEIFKKREKGETKEEKQARKAAIKQFKQDRKEKKKKFKENLETKTKSQLRITQKQATSLQGCSVYKLTI